MDGFFFIFSLDFLKNYAYIRNMKIYKQKRIDTNTLAGLKKAEWYKSHGWKIISVGFNSIDFEKLIERKIK